MSWSPVEDVFPEGQVSPVTLRLEENPAIYGDAIKLNQPVKGFVTGTIANPTYGSGIDFPLNGIPTWNRGQAIANRRYDGIIFP